MQIQTRAQKTLLNILKEYINGISLSDTAVATLAAANFKSEASVNKLVQATNQLQEKISYAKSLESKTICFAPF